MAEKHYFLVDLSDLYVPAWAPRGLVLWSGGRRSVDQKFSFLCYRRTSLAQGVRQVHFSNIRNRYQRHVFCIQVFQFETEDIGEVSVLAFIGH